MGRKRKKKKSKILKSKKIDKKSAVLQRTSVGEEKIEIKKIKKQPNEKRIFNVNDHVVYPKHGVGKITSVEKAVIGDIDINFYKVFVERDKLTLTIPINQQSGVDISALSKTLKEFISSNVLCLLDSMVNDHLGGTGKAFDWNIAKILAQKFPFLLAGGLTPKNVAQAISQVNPWGVDVSSGVETNYMKDSAKIAAFVYAAKTCEA